MNRLLLKARLRILRQSYKWRKLRKRFDLRDLDAKVEKLALALYPNAPALPVNQDGRIAIIATELYDSGGHSEWVRLVIGSFFGACESRLFLSRLDRSEALASRRLADIRQFIEVHGIAANRKRFPADLMSLYQQIVAYAPSVVLAFTHMDDILATALFALLKTHTKIRIVFVNHGSHFPSLGMSFADLILEGAPAMRYVTRHFRGVDKCHVIGLMSRRKDQTVYADASAIAAQRAAWGVLPHEQVSLTGCAAPKLFEGKRSPYLQMIKRLLVAEPALKHVLVSNFKKKHLKVVDAIFADAPDARARLVMVSMRPDFDILFQACDLFIDSFPVSSALTQVDLMRNKKTTVVKINTDNALFSFHEYMPEDYPYMFGEIDQMEQAVRQLLKDEPERQRMGELLYAHYLEAFEAGATSRKYLDVLHHSGDLSYFYEHEDGDQKYRFQGVRR